MGGRERTSAVTFAILGPLEVRLDGARTSVGGPRAQAILAALLLHVGERVSTETLIDLVWGEEPPPTARSALQVHISKLRRRLEELGASAGLATHGSSYSLEMSHDQLDARRFPRLVEEGRAHLAAGDAEAAKDALAEALALWRGFPLSDVDLPGLTPGAFRELEQQHHLASVLRLEAELDLGRHAEIVPDLMKARAGEPLDERLAELTAVALVRSGRQADALAELSALRR